MTRTESGLWSMVALCVALAGPWLGWVAVGASIIGAVLIGALMIGWR